MLHCPEREAMPARSDRPNRRRFPSHVYAPDAMRPSLQGAFTTFLVSVHVRVQCNYRINHPPLREPGTELGMVAYATTCMTGVGRGAWVGQRQQ